MKILMLVNWKVAYCDKKPPEDKQPPDYYLQGQPYWFFRYFKEEVSVDVIDIHSFPFLERFEKETLRFYVIQTLRVLTKLRGYDLILSHGIQSGVVLSLMRRLFRTKAKHVVFEIGSFQSASEQGATLKLMQFASKSIDGFIYHTSSQKEYYRRFFPWIVDKSRFIAFGADTGFFCANEKVETSKTILCVGYAKRDWDTLYEAFLQLLQEEEIDKAVRDALILKFVGKAEFPCEDKQVEVTPYLPVSSLCEEIEGALFCVVPLKEYNYSFGQMTLLQQMAMGKAVIASDVSSLRDYGKEAETVLFYEPENAAMLKACMKRLLTEEGLRTQLGSRAQTAVRTYYNERRMALEVEDYLRELLGEKEDTQ